ncbi:MAG: sporulation protein YabP [Thermaerobacter sp.]|nr:sporulation protein YabP [Thermaerobacter sp.]
MEQARVHSATLTNRQRLALEGVQHVDHFDDDSITLATEMGPLTIRGHGLRIQSLDLDNGQLLVVGEFDALIYGRKIGGRGTGQSVWQKMWR